MTFTLTVFKLSTFEEVGHSSANSNTQSPQPHTKFKPTKTNREITFYNDKNLFGKMMVLRIL